MNAEYLKNKSRKNKARQRERLRAIIRQAKDEPCFDCHIKYPYYIMQLDHVVGQKEFNIADSVSSGMSDIRLIREINKCQVVCANCHAERTHKRHLPEKTI